MHNFLSVSNRVAHPALGSARRTRRATIALIFGCGLLATSAFATPQDELRFALTAAESSSVATASSKAFLAAFNTIASKNDAQNLAANVSAAIELRPDLTAKIVASGVRLAVRSDDGGARAVVDELIQAAIAANPRAAVAIARAAVAAFPPFRESILSAAYLAAPDQRTSLLRALSSSSRYLYAQNTRPPGSTHGGGASEGGHGGNENPNSPEKPPRF